MLRFPFPSFQIVVKMPTARRSQRISGQPERSYASDEADDPEDVSTARVVRPRAPRAPSSGVVRPKKQDSPKTSPNAFFVFRKNFWKNEKRKQSGPVSTNHRVISKIAGIEWGRLSQQEQEPWYALAAEGKLSKISERSEGDCSRTEEAETLQLCAAPRYCGARAGGRSAPQRTLTKINEQLEGDDACKTKQVGSIPRAARSRHQRAAIGPSSSVQRRTDAPKFPYYTKEETDDNLSLCRSAFSDSDSPAFVPTDTTPLNVNSPLMFPSDVYIGSLYESDYAPRSMLDENESYDESMDALSCQDALATYAPYDASFADEMINWKGI